MLAKDTPSPVLVLLDKGASWEGTSEYLLVHWADKEVPQGHHSLPQMVEQGARSLRRDYLAWVHELGEYQVRGRNLKDYLQFRNDCSFWWLTLIAQKSPLKSPAIYQVFKLRVLENLYRSQGCCGVILYSADQVLHQVLETWCQNLQHPYRWQHLQVVSERSVLRERLRRLLPAQLWAVGSLVKHLWTRWLHLPPVQPEVSQERQATVLTYFPNIDEQLAQKGILYSCYWKELHQVLDTGPWRLNWIWMFTPEEDYSFAASQQLQRQVNHQSRGRATHYFLEHFLTFKGITRCVHRYLWLQERRLNLREIRRAFHFRGSVLNFWPVLAEEWRASFSGSEALQNCLYLQMFRTLTYSLPPQEWGLYLWENQPWERGLITAWNSAQSGRLIGYQHSTLRYLDIRFFEDPRSYRLGRQSPPLPDVLAINGQSSMSLLDDVGFPPERRLVVEAVRYMYMNHYGLPKIKQFSQSRGPSIPSCLLVVTGYTAAETREQLTLLVRVANKGGLKDFAQVLVKPHPDCPVEEILQNTAPALPVTIVREPLSTLLGQASLVYTANSTSASVEAAILKVPLLVHLQEDNFNLSPLMQTDGIVYVGTVSEFFRGLQADRFPKVGSDFFCLDPGLLRWRRLLGN